MSRALAHLLAAYFRLPTDARARFRASAEAAEAHLAAESEGAPVTPAPARAASSTSTDRVRAWRAAQRLAAATDKPVETRETVDETQHETHDETGGETVSLCVSSGSPRAGAVSESAQDLVVSSPSSSAEVDLKTDQNVDRSGNETSETRNETQRETADETGNETRFTLTPHEPSSDAPLTRTARRVLEHWQRVCGKGNTKITPARLALVRQRMREGFTEDELKTAATNVGASPWHRGENDKGAVYTSCELIYRNAAQVEKYRDLAAREDAPGGVSDYVRLSREYRDAKQRGDAKEAARLLPLLNAASAARDARKTTT